MTELPGIPAAPLSERAVVELAHELLDAHRLAEARDVLSRHLRRVKARHAGRTEILFEEWLEAGRPGLGFWEWAHGRMTRGEIQEELAGAGDLDDRSERL